MKNIYLIGLTILEFVFWLSIWVAGDVGSSGGNKSTYIFCIVLTSIAAVSVIGISIYNLVIGKHFIVPIIAIIVSIMIARITWPFIVTL